MKKIIYLVLFLSISTLVFSFGKKEVRINAADKIVVALLLDQFGIGDDSSNDGCYLGLQQAAEEGLLTLRVKSSKNMDDSVSILNNFVKDGVDVIVMIGEVNKALLIEASEEYVDTSFLGVDILFRDSDLKKNLFGITFREQDGGYLAGLVAGSLTYRFKKYHSYLNETNRVGIIVGKNSKDIKRYELGFFAGVKEVNQACEIISININDLNNPDKGAAALIELKEKGVDIVFSVAEKSNEGIFKAAEENQILIIGANKDLSNESNNILTSVVKKISVSVYLMIKEYATKSFETGENIIYGLNEGAISLAPYYNYDKFIPKELRVLISKMTSKLIKSSKVIPGSISEVEFNIEKIPFMEE